MKQKRTILIVENASNETLEGIVRLRNELNDKHELVSLSFDYPLTRVHAGYFYGVSVLLFIAVIVGLL